MPGHPSPEFRGSLDRCHSSVSETNTVPAQPSPHRFDGGAGSGQPEIISYWASFSVVWRAWINRTVPDLPRITSDSVVAPLRL